MKNHLLPALKLTFLCIMLLTFVYPALIWAIGYLSINKGNGDLSNIGQKFTEDKYFYSRPSAVDYNPSGSCGSNKGPSNPDYLNLVNARKDTFLSHNPNVLVNEIPVDLITASGSGLDPHISIKAAYIQVERIAAIRKIDKDKLKTLIGENAETPLLGPKRINVLKLNMALDKLN